MPAQSAFDRRRLARARQHLAAEIFPGEIRRRGRGGGRFRRRGRERVLGSRVAAVDRLEQMPDDLGALILLARLQRLHQHRGRDRDVRVLRVASSTASHSREFLVASTACRISLAAAGCWTTAAAIGPPSGSASPEAASERGQVLDQVRRTRARQRFSHRGGCRSAEALHVTHHEVVAGLRRASPISARICSTAVGTCSSLAIVGDQRRTPGPATWSRTRSARRPREPPDPRVSPPRSAASARPAA